MERNWLLSVMAAAAMVAAPVMADEAKDGDKPSETGAKVAQVSTASAATGATGAAGAQETKETAPAPKWTFGGSADVYYSSNFNDPPSGFNGLGVFDFKDEHGAHLGLIDIWAQHARDPWGFRIDLNWGDTARAVHFAEAPLSRHDLWEHIQQAYISVNLNRTGRTYLDFGRWVTPAGAEVIEPKDNWLYSRGILFGFAIPFTHTGFRAFHYFNDTDYVMAHVSRGWDVVSAPGHAVGFGLTYSKVLNPKWTFTGNWMGGDEMGPTGSEDFRNLVDLVLLYNMNDKWAFTGNFDYGTQPDAQWYGLSVQAKRTLDAKSYIAARGEWFSDADGFRTGADTNFFGVTLNYTRRWNKYLQTRAEFRFDWATDDVFESDSGVESGQPRVIISAIANIN